MIFVDDRAGSKDLIAPLRKLGVEVGSTRLEFGDVMWEGRGEKGTRVLVGIEFKKLEELVQAIRTERLHGLQMIGMRDSYRYSYLFIEGSLLYDKAGALQQRRTARFGKSHLVPMPGQMTVSELLKRIHVLHLCGGLTPWWTVNRDDTLQSILALYRTWTDKDLDKHKSHIAAYEAPSIIPISGRRRTLKTLPHIGLRASLAAEQKFGTLTNAVQAGVDEWASVEVQDDKGKTRRLGVKAAEDIVRFCRSRE